MFIHFLIVKKHSASFMRILVISFKILMLASIKRIEKTQLKWRSKWSVSWNREPPKIAPHYPTNHCLIIAVGILKHNLNFRKETNENKNILLRWHSSLTKKNLDVDRPRFALIWLAIAPVTSLWPRPIEFTRTMCPIWFLDCLYNDMTLIWTYLRFVHDYPMFSNFSWFTALATIQVVFFPIWNQ